MKKYIFLSACVIVCLSAKDEIKLDPVVVTATRTEIPSSKAPGSFSVITSNDIKKMPMQNFKDVIATQGVYINKGKGMVDSTPRIAIRGMPTSARNLIMLDGIILNDSYSNGIGFLSALNMQDIDQIEIIRGPFSSLYGTNAMGGVINFRTKIPTKPEFNFSYGYGDAFDSGNAYENLRQYYISAGGPIGERLRAKISYLDTATHGYRSTDATYSKEIEDTTGAILSHSNTGKKRYIIGDKGKNAWESKDFKFKTEFDLTQNDILDYSFMYHKYEYDYINPISYLRDLSGNTIFKPDEKTFLSGGGDYEQYIHSLGYEHYFDRGFLSLKYNYKNSKGKYATPQNGANLNGGKTNITPNDQNAHYITGFILYELNEFHKILFGTSYDRQEGISRTFEGSNYKDLNSGYKLLDEVGGKTNNLAFFLNLSSQLNDNLSSELALRYDRWKGYSGYTLDNVNTSNSFLANTNTKDSLSPKVSLAYEIINGTKIKTSAGKAFRAPTTYDLYKKWKSGSITYYPNQFLKPETSYSWDFGLEQNVLNDGVFKIYYFENRIEDMIYNKSSNNRKDKVNAGKAKTYGYEISLDMPLGYGFDINTNYTKTFSQMKKNDAEPKSVGKRLTYVPRDMFNLRLNYEYSKFYASAGVNYVSKVFGNDKNEDVKSGVYGSYDSYVLWDSKIGYKINNNFTLSLEVENIFDKEYYDYYKAQGRSWFAKVEAKF
ncbi:TonB-dependent receptor [Campylobacter sputorum]|uniref:TonB-dependent receptor n=1 Tax=Campylobacter sputorum TaxID=206 RepID=UPI00053BDB0C|nr:TonB-dependent receptor [Campylobacter sputorum]